MSRSRDFCQIFEGFGFGLEKFGLGKKVSVSVSEKIGLGKKSRFQFRKIWCRKKSLSIDFGQNFGIVIQWSPPQTNHHHDHPRKTNTYQMFVVKIWFFSSSPTICWSLEGKTSYIESWNIPFFLAKKYKYKIRTRHSRDGELEWYRVLPVDHRSLHRVVRQRHVVLLRYCVHLCMHHDRLDQH